MNILKKFGIGKDKHSKNLQSTRLQNVGATYKAVATNKPIMVHGKRDVTIKNPAIVTAGLALGGAGIATPGIIGTTLAGTGGAVSGGTMARSLSKPITIPRPIEQPKPIPIKNIPMPKQATTYRLPDEKKYPPTGQIVRKDMVGSKGMLESLRR